jgi:hypothetical protein
MVPARRALLLALPLLAAGLSGCTAYDDFREFLDRAQGKDEFVEVQRLNEIVDFAPTDPPSPGPPPGVGKRVNFTFEVPEGTTSLDFDVSVTFREPPLPVPGFPSGNVNVTLTPPSGSPRSLTFSETTAQSYSSTRPPTGSWSVLVNALGDGSVRVIALTVEPAPK